MQICVHDVFAILFFSFARYDAVSYYDTAHISVFIKYCATSAFCQHGMYYTTYDTITVATIIWL
jgi:hypothetical protein